MKRLLTLAVLFLCCVATSFAQFSGSGSGTKDDPYLIFNPIHLNQMRNFLNKSVYFKLMVDIDLTEFIEDEYPSQGWSPIGISSAPFRGILDGNGKTISGLWIKRSNSDYVGLFGSLSGGTVKNLNLKGKEIRGASFVGLLSGTGGTAIDCIFSGSVYGSSNVGGCVGSGGIFTRILSSVDVNAYGDNVGGISGLNGQFISCIVKNSYIIGNNYVGGICGAQKNNEAISDCSVQTNIKAVNYVGGICGENYPEERYSTSHIRICSFICSLTILVDYLEPYSR